MKLSKNNLVSMLAGVSLLLCASGSRGAAPCVAGGAQDAIEHVVIYNEPGHFAGWPANQGAWAWGDELLVSYEVGGYKLRDGNHAIDPEAPVKVMFSRSLDGGRTWAHEEHANVVIPWNLSRGDYAPKPKEPYDFTDGGFAMKFRESAMWLSKDRGHSWEGPFWISNRKDIVLLARTNYIVTGKNSALVFMTARQKQGDSGERKRNRSFVWRTQDGGRTFQSLALLGEADAFAQVDNRYDAYSIMPSAVQLSADRYVCAVREIIRRDKWVRIYESTDGGNTWAPIADIAEGAHNPAALVHLGGERIAAVYGSRENGPRGIYGRISEDGGHTWGEPVTLRADAANWDFGYPVALVRPDGAIVAVYYMSTEQIPNQHIAATIWKPAAACTPSETADAVGVARDSETRSGH